MKWLDKIKGSLPFLLVFGFSVFILIVSLRVTMFRYNNFEFGKFDLGNMGQMVYNSTNGNFMEVTDYFGGNMPRWGMSHVDPFLLVFVPFYFFFPDARVLVIGQLFLVILSSVILYFIGLKVHGSKIVSSLVAVSYLLYPAIGFLLAWTGFHGVTAVVPFFLLAFLCFEHLDSCEQINKRKMLLGFFYLFMFLTMMGKEEISLVIAFYGAFILFFRRSKKVGASLIISGLFWFAFCFGILIPQAAKYRISSYENFATSIGLELDPQRDVLKPNYFLSRYDKFGDSYSDVILNFLTNPKLVSEVVFSGDKKENFVMTFKPVLFLPFFYLPTFVIALPELLINYLTTSGGIGTSEIYNHRISMIIPILFVSLFFSFRLFENFLKGFFRVKAFRASIVSFLLSGVLLITNYQLSKAYGNPILLWFMQAVERRLSVNILTYAKEAKVSEEPLVPGAGAKVKMLENKDRSCLEEIVKLVPPKASVTAPDYLGAHFSSRRVNALFPSNFNTSDYVVVDLFSRKVSTILGVDQKIVNRAVDRVVRDPSYALIYSCSNMFVFERLGEHGKEVLLPFQENFSYEEIVDYNIGLSLNLVDFDFSKEVRAGEPFSAKFVYKKSGDESLNSFVLYTTFKKAEGNLVYQIANLPSFGFAPLNEWEEGSFYLEENSFVLPKKLDLGKYNVFVGITNGIKSYNIYIGDLWLK